MYRLAVFLMVSIAAAAPKPSIGPADGSLLVVGRGRMTPELWQEFISLAGGPESLILIVPTASGSDTFAPDFLQKSGLYRAGARNLKMLHTTDRAVADSVEFVAP